MSRRKTILLIAAWCTVMAAIAANVFDHVQVSGQVKDKADGKPLEFVTVVLLNGQGAVVAAGSTSKDGTFALSNVPPGSYTLKTSSMGYAERTMGLQVSGNSDEMQVLTITLTAESQQLNEATISSTKNRVEYDIDKTIINVSDFISAEGGNAVDVLRKIAGISIDNEGNVSLNGQPASVTVDGRPSNLSGQDLLDLLYFLDASNIDKIEIIQNPSAKYDAAGGGGIINIRTKNNFLNGLSGSVQTGGGYYLHRGNDHHLHAGLTLNYRNKWLNTVLTANTRKDETFSGADGHYRSSTPAGTLQQHTHTGTEYTGQSRSVQLTNSFHITPKHLLGMGLSGMWRHNDGQSDDGSGFTTRLNDQPETNATIANTSTREVANYSANLNYRHIFKESVHELLLDADYMHYRSDARSKEQTRYYNAVQSLLHDTVYSNTSGQDVQTLSAKADYHRPLWENGRLEAGGKLSETGTHNALLREDRQPSGEWQPNTGLSNTFRYRERVGALYASIGTALGESKQWDAKAGLRWENTRSQGNWQTQRGDTSTRQHYHSLFPSLYLGFTPAAGHRLSLSYALRIQRPGYHTLNPFRSYSTTYGNMYTQGNPALQPQYTHSLHFGYSYEKFNITLVTQRTTQVITQETFIDTTEAGYPTAVTWGNFGKSRFTGLTASLSNIFAGTWWSFNLHASGLYTTSLAQDYEDRRFYTSIYMENTFYLGRTWRAELTGSAQSPLSYGYSTISGQYFVSAGIRKNLWNYQATIALYVDDLFNSQQLQTVTTRQGQHITMNNTWSSRQIRLSFSYRFREMKTRNTNGE